MMISNSPPRRCGRGNAAQAGKGAAWQHNSSCSPCCYRAAASTRGAHDDLEQPRAAASELFIMVQPHARLAVRPRLQLEDVLPAHQACTARAMSPSVHRNGRMTE
jgi:hypothetical protein